MRAEEDEECSLRRAKVRNETAICEDDDDDDDDAVAIRLSKIYVHSEVDEEDEGPPVDR